MIISVVPDLVPLVHNSTNKPRVTLRVHTHQEKRGFYVRRFENVQDRWRVPRSRTVVKGDCDLMLVRSPRVIQRGDLRKLNVVRGEMTVWIQSDQWDAV